MKHSPEPSGSQNQIEKPDKSIGFQINHTQFIF